MFTFHEALSLYGMALVQYHEAKRDGTVLEARSAFNSLIAAQNMLDRIVQENLDLIDRVNPY